MCSMREVQRDALYAEKRARKTRQAKSPPKLETGRKSRESEDRRTEEPKKTHGNTHDVGQARYPNPKTSRHPGEADCRSLENLVERRRSLFLPRNGEDHTKQAARNSSPLRRRSGSGEEPQDHSSAVQRRSVSENSTRICPPLRRTLLLLLSSEAARLQPRRHGCTAAARGTQQD